MEFAEFQAVVRRARESVDRTVRDHERRIKEKTGISDSLFRVWRQDIVSLHDLFCRHDLDNSGSLGQDEITHVFLEFGLLPQAPAERKVVCDMIADADRDQDCELNFEEFLELTGQIRAHSLEGKREAEHSVFTRYDRDGSGSLSVKEVSVLLCDVGCAPKTRKEQEELSAIIRMVDADGSGQIDFNEFQVLSQRIEE